MHTDLDGLDHFADHLLRHIHNVVVIGVGHVELAGRELGVVGQVDALIPATSLCQKKGSIM